MRVLVTDGNERAALAATRALGREQIEVVVGAEVPRSLAGSSRYCQQSIVYPSPYQEPERFVTHLLEAVREHQVDALFPVSDIAMHVLGPEKSRFEPQTHIPIPVAAVFQEISDKYRLMRQAVEQGVPIPDTLFVPDGRLEGVIDGITEFPVVIKPGVESATSGASTASLGIDVAVPRENSHNKHWFSSTGHFPLPMNCRVLSPLETR